MKKEIKILTICFVLFFVGAGVRIFVWNQKSKVEKFSLDQNSLFVSGNMEISSPAFENGGEIPIKYTCQGEDINPPLEFSGVPPQAKSLVLVVDDPDAPGGTWVHWTVWNIPPTTKAIPERSVPQGAREGITDFGRPGWGGPCPPSGTHRYFFRLYALDVELDLSPQATREELDKAMEGHILDKAEMFGLYKRR